jgi:hypothetical protein
LVNSFERVIRASFFDLKKPSTPSGIYEFRDTYWDRAWIGAIVGILLFTVPLFIMGGPGYGSQGSLALVPAPYGDLIALSFVLIGGVYGPVDFDLLGHGLALLGAPDPGES